MHTHTYTHPGLQEVEKHVLECRKRLDGVCVDVCVCVCVRTHVCACVCAHVCAPMCFCVQKTPRRQVCARVRVLLCVFACVYVHLRACLCMCVRVTVCTHMCEFACYQCTWMSKRYDPSETKHNTHLSSLVHTHARMHTYLTQQSGKHTNVCISLWRCICDMEIHRVVASITKNTAAWLDNARLLQVWSLPLFRNYVHICMYTCTCASIMQIYTYTYPYAYI